MHAEFTMEDLFEFLFGASGRINRAKYWRSLLIFSVAGLFAAVILFTAAGIATPLLIIMVVVVLIPWLIWGFAIHTERLHDRDKSAWWLLLFYGAGLARPVCESGLDCGGGRHCTALHPRTGRLCPHDLGICRDRMPARHRRAQQIWLQPACTLSAMKALAAMGKQRLRAVPEKQKSPVAIRPPGEIGSLGSMLVGRPYPRRRWSSAQLI
jgi:hypothetical protein